MKVTTQKQDVVQDGKVIRTMYQMTIENNKGQKMVISVGEKTANAIKELNELEKSK